MSEQPRASRRPRSLVTKRITVPGNLRLACDLFNSGQFWHCHEALEEVWQEEQGDVRDLYKGLIQVAAAYVHVGRNNQYGVRRLLTTALTYLAPYRPAGAMGFNLEEICQAAERALAALESLPPGRTSELARAHLPVYRLDEALLPAEARRWGAWGFDPDGNPLDMEVTVVD